MVSALELLVSVPEPVVSALEPSVELVDAELPPSSPQAVSTSVEIRSPSTKRCTSAG
jgi:hypothetical protein